MQMKRDPINGHLICLVRLYEEVSPAPFWTEPCLFWTRITHVTDSLQRHPPPSRQQTTPQTFESCLSPISSFACVHYLRHSGPEKKKSYARRPIF